MWPVSLAALAAAVATDVGRFQALRQSENCVYPYEIVFVQDSTASFESFFARMVTDELETLFDALEGAETTDMDGSDEEEADSTTNPDGDVSYSNLYGLVSFRDKPIWPLGNAATPENSYEDYCAVVDVPLTANRTRIVEWFATHEAQGGGDYWENQFGAMYLAAESPAIQWAEEPLATRMLVLVTDAPPHYQNDPHVVNTTAATGHNFSQFRGIAPNATSEDLSVQCLAEDYPSASQLTAALHEKDIKVAFLIHDESDNQTVMKVWKWFNSEMLNQPEFFVVDMTRDGQQFGSKVSQIIQSERRRECFEEEEVSSSTEDEEDCELFPTDGTSTDPGDDDDDPTEGVVVDETALVACLSQGGERLSFLTASSASFGSATVPFNLFYPQMWPAAIVYAQSEADVSLAVRCAVAQGVKIVPRSSGHDYASFSFGQNNTMVVDVSDLDGFQLDSDGRAVVGPGLRVGTFVYQAYTSAARLFPGGSLIDMGIGGFVLGGGFGYFSRAYGLAVDSVASMRMVDYNGDILTANRTHNSDLFWALRGGGNGNFGIVTEIEMDLVEAPSTVSAATFLFQPSQFETVMASLINMTNNAPRQLGLRFEADVTSIMVQTAFVGTQSQLKEVVEPYFDYHVGRFVSSYRETNYLVAAAELAIPYMLARGRVVNMPPIIDDRPSPYLGALPSHSIIATSQLLLPREYQPIRSYFKAHSLIFTDRHPVDTEVVQTLSEYYGAALNGTHPTFSLAFELMGGNDSAIRTDQYNAWPWRDAEWLLHFYSRSSVLLPEADVAFISELREALQDQAGSSAVYVNFHDDSLYSPLEDYYGTSLRRLQAIKTAYDPLCAFYFPQVILPHNEEEAGYSSTNEQEMYSSTFEEEEYTSTTEYVSTPADTDASDS